MTNMEFSLEIFPETYPSVRIVPSFIVPRLARKNILLADTRIGAHDRLAGLRGFGDEVFSVSLALERSLKRW